jgi:hypothetical protein
MFTTLTKLATKYDVSTNTLKKTLSKHTLIEGKHFVMIGTIQRFSIEEIHKIIAPPKKEDSTFKNILDRFLLKS